MVADEDEHYALFPYRKWRRRDRSPAGRGDGWPRPRHRPSRQTTSEADWPPWCGSRCDPPHPTDRGHHRSASPSPLGAPAVVRVSPFLDAGFLSFKFPSLLLCLPAFCMLPPSVLHWRLHVTEEKNDQIDSCCWLCLCRRNIGASNDARADSSAGQHDHASGLRLRPV
jgi:hypothetical protein